MGKSLDIVVAMSTLLVDEDTTNSFPYVSSVELPPGFSMEIAGTEYCAQVHLCYKAETSFHYGLTISPPPDVPRSVYKHGYDTCLELLRREDPELQVNPMDFQYRAFAAYC